MKKTAAFFAVLLVSGTAYAVVPTPTLPAAPPMPAPQISGVKAAVLIDVNTDQVLLDQNGQASYDPSGLVKLMTAYLLYQAEAQKMLQPDQHVSVSVDAWHAAGSRMFIQPGLPVTIDQLTHGLLIDGGNDAAIAIAQSVAGSVGGFVDLMNREAASMGLTQTHFVNPDGMPTPGQRSTALDIARLARALLVKFPQVEKVAGQASYRYNNITQYNYNPLAGQHGITGLGVGLASANNWDLAVSASQEGRDLVAVILGASSRAVAGTDAAAMLHYGFHGWQQRQVYPAGAVVAQLKRIDWSPETLSVITPKAINVVVPRPSQGKVESRFVAAANLQAPIAANSNVGTLDLLWQGKILKAEPVLAKNAVAKAGWFSRLWHRAQGAL
ncbi:D-alanyl-D-alanine carboxypeptidase family protein [Acidithiobacillus sp. AMEEHan]|uniref:D-alanyl-D-alanine carboxypeptidase family protein n=1 Tax=Acidithiobacillus sp. AMEEHan TaxID=2994951 RepID=UPI0027E5136D|nr:D-alanyl-D-alanine carboxypeptidase family protein [Acidithiobacillus sp. AMEEHan]